LGDAHALDAGQPVASLALRACRVSKNSAQWGGNAAAEFAESDDVTSESDDAQVDARGLTVRDQWARVGVVVSELSAPVLCLNLPTAGESSCAQLLRTAKACAEPIHLTLRALLRDPPVWDVSGVIVYVCENPSIVGIA